MRAAPLIVVVLMLAGSAPAAPAHAQSCADDYLSAETIKGEIIDIRPAPDPFKTADIYFSGPKPCERIWMQVFKTDAERCHVGQSIEAKGIVTSDAENNAWQMGSVVNDYMMLGQDFMCG